MVVPDDLATTLDRLGYDFQAFDLAHFIQHVETYRQRTIFVNPLPLQLELSAAWVRAETADYIFYNQDTHPVQQTHSILHEIAHILLEHPCHPLSDVLSPKLLNRLQNGVPHGRPRLADAQLRASPEEREAEAFVLLIQQRLVNARRLSELTGPSSSIRALRYWVDGMAFTG